MKRLWVFLFAVSLMFTAFSATAPTVARAASNNVMIAFESAGQNGNELTIDVDMKQNSGICAMLLTLKYDRSALTLTGIEHGTALSELGLFPSQDLSTDPFKIMFGPGQQNDTSTGRMMRLTFAVKVDAPDGVYTVTFDYTRDQDVNYLADGKMQTKNLVITGARITLKDGKVDVFDAENTDGAVDEVGPVDTVAPSGDSSGQAPKNNTVGVIVACSVVGVMVIAIAAVLMIGRRKRN